MKVIRDGQIEANVPFNPAMLDCDNIGCDMNTFIPYNDKTLVKELNMLIWRIGIMNDWYYSNCDTAKLTLVINTYDEQPSLELIVEVEPPHWSKKDKAKMLKHASKEPKYTDSDETPYSDLLTIFTAAEDFHKGNHGDNYEYYPVQLTAMEMQKLKSFMVQNEID